MKNTRTLYNAVRNQGGHISFHTPGHRFRCEDTIVPAFADTTEISVTDELYHPVGPILTAEKEAAEAFGVKNVCFSAGGATLCIQTALSFYAGKKVLTERSCHISVINASALLDIDLHFAWGQPHEKMGFAVPVTPEQIETMLKSGGYSAVFITSPNYYGMCADVKGIRAICDEYGVDLITDNSHGSHLSAMYPDDRYRNAEKHSHFAINSLHKTLPVMTGGAVLCSNTDISKEKIKQHMAIFGSTSPSFPILASVDFGIAHLAENTEEYLKTANKVAALADKVKALGYGVLPNQKGDTLRLCLDTFPMGYYGSEVAELIEEKGIFAEMTKDCALVFLFSPFNTDEDLDALYSALASIKKRTKIPYQKVILPNPPKRIFTLKEALLSPTEYIPTDASAGRISAETFATCPPGMAIVVSGEEISEEAAKTLSKHKKWVEVIA